MVVKREVSLRQRIEHYKCQILGIRNGEPSGAASYPERNLISKLQVFGKELLNRNRVLICVLTSVKEI
jgi:hypothetical protein